MANDKTCKNMDAEDQKKEKDQPTDKNAKKSSSPWAGMEKKKEPSRKRGWSCGSD